jgi:hypothetical protein
MKLANQLRQDAGHIFYVPYTLEKTADVTQRELQGKAVKQGVKIKTSRLHCFDPVGVPVYLIRVEILEQASWEERFKAAQRELNRIRNQQP